MILIVLVAVISVLVAFIVTQFTKPKNFPPGPAFIPIVGYFYELKKLSRACGSQHLAFSRLSDQFNTNVLGLKVGSELIVVVSTFPVIRKLMTDEVFEGRPDNFFMRLRSMGRRRGITSADGDLWNVQRDFTLKHLKRFGMGKGIMNTLIRNEITKFLETLPEPGIDMKKVLALSVINVTWYLTSGSGIEGNEERIRRLINIMNERSKAFDMVGGIINIFPWIRFFAPKSSGFELISQMNEKLHKLFMETIEDHNKKWSADKNDDLVYAFLTELKNGTETFTNDQLVMVLLDIFIAGSQTTSTSIDFALMMMILRPDIQDKIQHLLDTSFGKQEPIDYSERHKVPYVEAVLMETLRYFMITPIIGPRRALRNTKFEGYTIPKNTTILISIYSVYYDKSYWKDPEEFRPERFIDEDGKLFFSENLIPFGLGKRRCIGDLLARNFIFTFFSEIVRKYKIDQIPGSPPPSMVPEPGIVLSPRPYSVRFTSRN